MMGVTERQVRHFRPRIEKFLILSKIKDMDICKPKMG